MTMSRRPRHLNPGYRQHHVALPRFDYNRHGVLAYQLDNFLSTATDRPRRTATIETLGGRTIAEKYGEQLIALAGGLPYRFAQQSYDTRL